MVTAGLADAVYTYDADKLAVFRESDFVICSLPGTAETLDFCGKEEFAGTSIPGVSNAPSQKRLYQ